MQTAASTTKRDASASPQGQEGRWAEGDGSPGRTKGSWPASFGCAGSTHRRRRHQENRQPSESAAPATNTTPAGAGAPSPDHHGVAQHPDLSASRAGFQLFVSGTAPASTHPLRVWGLGFRVAGLSLSTCWMSLASPGTALDCCGFLGSGFVIGFRHGSRFWIASASPHLARAPVSLLDKSFPFSFPMLSPLGPLGRNSSGSRRFRRRGLVLLL